MSSYGFIILRHVNNEQTNKYWIESYKCIRKFYTNKIMIIDDNSDNKYITKIELKNTVVIQSEYPKRGELLPYIYYLRNRLFKKAIIIHDSVFIKKYLNFSFQIIDDFFLWHFEHNWDDTVNEINLLKKLDNHIPLHTFYLQKTRWKGCFGGMSIISYHLLEKINNKYNLSNLIPHITSRNDRMLFERIIAVLISFEKKSSKLHKNSIFGNIHQYSKWGYTFDEYIEDVKNNKINKSIIKVWTGR